METLKYTVIKSETQYDKYCDELEKLLDSGSESKAVNDEIELITVLIENWDEEHNTFEKLDPVEILKSLMKEHKMKSVDMAALLGVSEGLVSDMLKYKKGFSKETIRILSQRFKLRQEAFNRPYNLIPSARPSSKKTPVSNTQKKKLKKASAS